MPGTDENLPSGIVVGKGVAGFCKVESKMQLKANHHHCSFLIKKKNETVQNF